jgi:5-(carboxyamino)imidazole ribonucleotide synthase
MPLGATDMRGAAMMLNWIGEMPAIERLLQVPGLRWHDYGKKPRAGRKVGHATLIAADQASLVSAAGELVPLLDPQMGSLVMGEIRPEA